MQEKYFGSNLKTSEYDRLALKVIPKNLMKEEKLLYDTKWFDYCGMHPTEATFLFASHYVNQYRLSYQKNRDVNFGQIVMPFAHPSVKKEEELWKKIQEKRKTIKENLRLRSENAKTKEELVAIKYERAEFSRSVKRENAAFEHCKSKRPPLNPMQTNDALPLWKARQACDRIGMPYDLYLSSVFRFLIEDRIWQRLPRPTHLYSSEVTEFAFGEWKAILDTKIIDPTICDLKSETDYHIELSEKAERWLCSIIKTRKNPHFGLAHYMFEKNFISEKTALQFFHSSTIERAKRSI